MPKYTLKSVKENEENLNTTYVGRASTRPSYLPLKRFMPSSNAFIARAMVPYQVNMFTPAKAENNLDIIISDLMKILTDDDEFDEHYLRPTSYACGAMLRLLVGANAHVLGGFPLGAIFPDGYGGLCLEWKFDSRMLRLIVPPSAEAPVYLYYYSPTEEDTNFVVDVPLLGKRLNWLRGTPGVRSYRMMGLPAKVGLLNPLVPVPQRPINQYAGAHLVNQSSRQDLWQILRTPPTKARKKSSLIPQYSIAKS
jgi:hypothetical protein